MYDTVTLIIILSYYYDGGKRQEESLQDSLSTENFSQKKMQAILTQGTHFREPVKGAAGRGPQRHHHLESKQQKSL